MDKCKQTRYLIDKANLGKIAGVYVTFMADVGKGQVVTLVWSFKSMNDGIHNHKPNS